MNPQEILNQMTLEEKAAFCSGRDFWHTKAIDRLGIPSVMMCDGPHGLRKQEGDHLGINKSIETVCYPTAAALASSFDRNVVMRQLGQALGKECQAEGVSILLGPGLNIKRSPLCGRNFEYFSEDSYLAGGDGRCLCGSASERRNCRLRQAFCLQQPGNAAHERLLQYGRAHAAGNLSARL